jgi:N6-L-threonylcarbamoyladenine synthase
MQHTLTVLGIETSCDETAAAVVRLDADGAATILSNVVWSQFDAHRAYGGVVPEIAARAHVEATDRVIAEAMVQAGVDYDALDAVAATAGPGLIGGVMVGLIAGKAVALAWDKPLVAVNHLEAHALSARLAGPCPFPYLLLLVSGGHCQLLAVEGLGQVRRLGATIDDAVGEAFDKTAKVLGLGFPGGPAVERAALAGDPARFDLPRPLLHRPGLDMSFAGLKTAVLREAEALGDLTDRDRADLAAGFQTAVGDLLADRAGKAMDAEPALAPRFVVAGGVAANAELRARLEAVCARRGWTLIAPPPQLCTDNGAMVALAGALRAQAGLFDPLDAPARPRWPLDADAAAAAPMHKAGRKGVRA